MKTISVKEAAALLGVTTRTVQYKLQNGDLKGNRAKNQFGVLEWRIYPNKEIQQAASTQAANNLEENKLYFEPEEEYVETIDAEEVIASSDAPTSWRDVEMERLEIMAEKLMKPLAQRLEAQAVAITEQQKIIEDQKRQLLLLPDLQKQAQEERKTAQDKIFEVESLKKQIAALETEKAAGLNKPWWKKLLG
jgi:excisionase family DNA binding protein